MRLNDLLFPTVLALSTSSCIPQPMRDYLSMYGELGEPSRRAVANVLRDGNNVQVDPMSRTYTVSSTLTNQFGYNHHCTLTPDDLRDVSTIDRHIATLQTSIQTARTDQGLSQAQVGSACWCLQLMQSVRTTLLTGNTTFVRQTFPACTNTCMCSVPRSNFPPIPDDLGDGGVLVN